MNTPEPIGPVRHAIDAIRNAPPAAMPVPVVFASLDTFFASPEVRADVERRIKLARDAANEAHRKSKEWEDEHTKAVRLADRLQRLLDVIDQTDIPF